jgi:hypothetical protein
MLEKLQTNWRRGWESSNWRRKNAQNRYDLRKFCRINEFWLSGLGICLILFTGVRQFCQRDVTRNVTRNRNVSERFLIGIVEGGHSRSTAGLRNALATRTGMRSMESNGPLRESPMKSRILLDFEET